jgi:genome maintenance exonuclease 1
MKFQHKPLPFEEIDSYMKNGMRFYKAPGGPYPSITTILGGTADKAWLDGWKASLGPKKAAAESHRCADRGTAVHLLAERYLQNDPDYDAGQTHENKKLFNQIKIHINKINNILGQEVPLYSELLQVAGRCDVVAEFDGVLSIIDFKTSNGIKNDDIINDYFLQCTAYSLMIEEMFGIVIDQIVVIITIEKGLNGQVFKRDRSQYIGELIHRVRKFHGQRQPK